jgi:hypothetical protein
MDLLVARADAPDLSRLVSRLNALGLPSTVMMVDNQLHAPGAPIARWQDVRLRTPAGMVTLKRRPDGIAVVVFGNADEALQRAQRLIADALKETDQ